jgi:hypothetical protein
MAASITYQGQQFFFSTCPRCKVLHAYPQYIYDAAQARKGSKKVTGYLVFCPNGHEWHFTEGESVEDELRRERDLLKQRLAQKDDQIANERDRRQYAERSASARKGQVTRLKNRVAAGVCPCCNRSFENLRRHMSSQHPAFIAEEVA